MKESKNYIGWIQNLRSQACVKPRMQHYPRLCLQSVSAGLNASAIIR